MPVGDAAALDAAKLEQFVTRAVEEVGATVGAALVVMGDQLGLYRALAGAGALTSGELAARTGTAERYVREWLNAQAAGGYVKYHADEGRYVSGHSTTSGAASEVLAAYFPTAAARLRAWADEAAVSRLYGGIHFASDNEAGLELGRTIARATVRRYARSRPDRRAPQSPADRGEPPTSSAQSPRAARPYPRSARAPSHSKGTP